MRRLPGQAARQLGRCLHAVATWFLVFLLMAAVGVGALAWRLAQGPLEIDWFARRLEAAVNEPGSPTQLHVGALALAWNGFHGGIDAPVVLQLSRATAIDPDGVVVADIPHAEMALSLESLLRLQIRPESITVDSPRMRLLRSPNGGISLDLGNLANFDSDTASSDTADKAGPGVLPGWVDELAGPAPGERHHSDAAILAKLQHVHIHTGSIVVVDRQLGATWRVPHVAIDLDRRPQGGLDGTLAATLALGDQAADLRIVADLQPGGARTTLRADLTPLRPAALARASPRLAPLEAVDLPITVALNAVLDASLAVQDSSLRIGGGPGQVHINGTTIVVDRAELAAGGNAAAFKVDTLQLAIRPSPRGALSQITGSADGGLGDAGLKVNLTLGLDRVAFADLPTLWPPGVGGKGGRSWVTENITAGVAHDLHLEAMIAAKPDFSDLALTRISGQVQGDALTVHWLRPIPPIENGRAILRFVDPDTLQIDVLAGNEHADPGQTAPLTVRSGSVRITGIEQKDQFGDIEADLAGGLAEAVALLSQPRLHLLEKHPLPLKAPSGQVAVRLSIKLPLDNDVKIEQIATRVAADLRNVHLAEVIAGRNLDKGMFHLDVTNDGLTANGSALLAGIAVRATGAFDFRAGPPSQVLQTVSASARATASQIRAAGLDTGPLLSGSASLRATFSSRRDGRGTVAADADLTAAELSGAPLAWHKPAGSPGKASARILLQNERLVGIEAVDVEARDLSIHGAAETQGGHVAALRVERMVLGRSRAGGVIRFPPRDDPTQPIRASVVGSVLDLSAVTAAAKGKPAGAARPTPPGAGKRGQPWAVDARFDSVLVAAGHSFTGVAGSAENDGEIVTRARLDGMTAPGAPFHAELQPRPGGRELNAEVTDTGAVLAAFAVRDLLFGGRLQVAGWFDDQRAGHPLDATARLTSFRVHDPKGLGTILKAMTLYGLVDVLSGPGLTFAKLDAPFRLNGDVLELGQARAFSPSLGVTAQGRLDLASDTVDLRGTIVPAYFFNALPGKIPFIGRVFSPEKGGGLFAADFSVKGKLDDPGVSVNPFSLLTPGILRELFDLF